MLSENFGIKVTGWIAEQFRLQFSRRSVRNFTPNRIVHSRLRFQYLERCRYLATGLLNQVGNVNLGIHDFAKYPPRLGKNTQNRCIVPQRETETITEPDCRACIPC